MFTQFITFAIIVAIIGCIMYGRKLIRTEKIDAVFGNPERALSGFPKTASIFSVRISFRPYIIQPIIATIIAKVIN